MADSDGRVRWRDGPSQTDTGAPALANGFSVTGFGLAYAALLAATFIGVLGGVLRSRLYERHPETAKGPHPSRDAALS